jgi:hypothetical protein
MRIIWVRKPGKNAPLASTQDRSSLARPVNARCGVKCTHEVLTLFLFKGKDWNPGIFPTIRDSQ